MSKRTLVRLAVCALLVVYGFVVGRYEVFPFRILKTTKTKLFNTEDVPVSSEAMWRMDVSHFEDLSIDMATTRPVIVMLGDSITARAEWHELFPDCQILNRGVPRDTTQGALARIDHVTALEPMAVFVMLGVNDFHRGSNVGTVYANYKKLIQGLDSTKVFVQSTLAVGSQYKHRRKQIQLLNQRLAKYCELSSVEFIDLNQHLAPQGDLEARFTLDGVHLNGEGYRVWATCLRSRMDTLHTDSLNGPNR